MNAEKCLAILREIKDVAFATIDNAGNPQIRIIDIMHVEPDSLYFLTARGKDFYKELLLSGKGAITALTNNYEMIRLQGDVIKVTDQSRWLDFLFQKNPSMNAVYPGTSRGILEVFCIKTGKIEYFDLGKTPIFRECYSIGGKKLFSKGYEIKNECIQCGKCANLCPQACILEGNPYKINQYHCLHCGLCYENCPVNAIVKKGNNSA